MNDHLYFKEKFLLDKIKLKFVHVDYFMPKAELDFRAGVVYFAILGLSMVRSDEKYIYTIAMMFITISKMKTAVDYRMQKPTTDNISKAFKSTPAHLNSKMIAA